MLLSQSPVWRSTASTYQSRSDLVACTGMVGPAYSPTQRAKPGKLRQNRAKWGKRRPIDRKSTRLNSSHDQISYAVFCLKKKNSVIERKLHDLGDINHVADGRSLSI